MIREIETQRLLLTVIAVLGSIGLGIAQPDRLGTAAIGVLSGAVGGYYGLSQAKKA
jgi:hypothetical protein